MLTIFSKKTARKISGAVSASAFALIALSACGGGNGGAGSLGSQLLPNAYGAGDAPASPSCHSDDPNKICVGLKYVSYTDSSGKPVVSAADAAKNLTGINSEWAQCGVAFQIDQYQSVNPKDLGLTFNTANNDELDKIRTALQDSNHMLVVTTGDWDRSGSLGNTGANAWTSMPGAGPYGTVLEANVGTFANIIAHELGHYMGLDHVSDQSMLMNPTIYEGKLTISQDECKTVRDTVNSVWGAMKR